MTTSANTQAITPETNLADQQSGLLEHFEVLRDCGKRHGEGQGQFLDRRLTLCETAHDHPARGVRERVEDIVELLAMVKHVVNCCI